MCQKEEVLQFEEMAIKFYSKFINVILLPGKITFIHFQMSNAEEAFTHIRKNVCKGHMKVGIIFYRKY